MADLIRQKKNKVFPHSPYDQYSHFSPVFGFFVDDDNKSETFGEVLFGQIGERNDFEMVQSFKDDCDMKLIKEQLLKSAKESDWNAEFVDYNDEEVEAGAEFETSDTVDAAKCSDEIFVQSGASDQQDKKND